MCKAPDMTVMETLRYTLRELLRSQSRDFTSR
jgi:hypothetical protein